MQHFFAPYVKVSEGEFSLTGPDVKHIVKVLRMKPGEKLVVSNAQDRDLYCEIKETGPDFVLVRVLEDAPSAEMTRRIVLFQGLPKSDKMDYIVTKAVELGASGLVPVVMKRSIVQLDDKKKEARRVRWQAKARSAATQSGRSLIPAVEEVVSMAEAIGMASRFDHILVPYESADNMAYTRAVLAMIPAGSRVAVFIGPEGGFDPSEIEALKAAGAKVITLGPRILRTETAGPAFLAMAALLWED